MKFDGFRAIADAVNGRMLSKRGNRMHRFGSLPADCVLDGEIVALAAVNSEVPERPQPITYKRRNFLSLSIR